MSAGRKRVYLGVMVVGACALAVDRCVISDGVGNPSPAVASGSTAPSEVVLSQAIETGAEFSIPELPFPRGLEPFDQQSPIRDPFALPESILAAMTADSQTDKHGSSASGHQRLERLSSGAFSARHRLSGVLLQERLRIAVVDMAWVRIGQSLEGCRLTAVSGIEARFECYDGEAVLTVTNTAAAPRD